MRWPLTSTPALPPPQGSFGAVRKHDVHTGVDLYCELGSPVLALEEGVVVAVEPFTGPAADSPWWNDTLAVLVQGPSGVFVYGEVEPHVAVGDFVQEGQHIASVNVPVLRKDKGSPTTMLHLELMEPGSTNTVWWHLGQERPECLLDPTKLLRSLL